MATFNVTLPDAMKAWVEAQAEGGRYSNASDYLRNLISRDQERAEALAGLQRAFDDGFASGESDRSMDDVLNTARREARVTHRP